MPLAEMKAHHEKLNLYPIVDTWFPLSSPSGCA
jgi:hypothetical protein